MRAGGLKGGMVILLSQLGRANEHSEPSGVGVYSRRSAAIMLCVGNNVRDVS